MYFDKYLRLSTKWYDENITIYLCHNCARNKEAAFRKARRKFFKQTPKQMISSWHFKNKHAAR